jgi:hypothetical protein
MNDDTRNKRVTVYRLLIAIAIVLFIIVGSLFRQNSLLNERNRRLTIQIDSIISLNIELKKNLEMQGR